MPSSDAAFFKRKKERVTRYRLKRNELWVAEATQILNAFMDSLDATSDAFVFNYFPRPEQPYQPQHKLKYFSWPPWTPVFGYNIVIFTWIDILAR